MSMGKDSTYLDLSVKDYYPLYFQLWAQVEAHQDRIKRDKAKASKRIARLSSLLDNNIPSPLVRARGWYGRRGRSRRGGQRCSNQVSASPSRSGSLGRIIHQPRRRNSA